MTKMISHQVVNPLDFLRMLGSDGSKDHAGLVTRLISR
jgi:hypothetical protein